MSVKSRGEISAPTDILNLTVQFYDVFGNPANTTSFPQISIIQPNGTVAMSFTSAGVSQLDVGKYLYQFTVPFNGPYGVWNDVWQGEVAGIVSTQTLSFIVDDTQIPKMIDPDGYVALGDDPGFHYSQTATRNINKLLKTLKARLNNDGMAQTTDEFGNIQYITCSIFSNDMLATFVANALTDFNQIPYFTFFTFEDTAIIDQFHDILVEGATIFALASQALIERGREYQLTDNGVNFTPPGVSEILNTQYNTMLTNYFEKLKLIKNSMRPAPKAMGVFGVTSVRNPQFARLKHLRERRII